ncbi:MAG: iron ABC transporter permease [Kiloniellales bacterium]
MAVVMAAADRAIEGAGSQRRRARAQRLAFLLLAFIAALLAGLGIGAVPISPGEIAHILMARIGLISLDPELTTQSAVLLSIRAPRVVLGMLVGGALSTCGAALQGLFRNPLADPQLIGVSAGAALAAVTVIVFGAGLAAVLPSPLDLSLLPVAAFFGGLIVTLIIQRMARRHGETDVATLLLAGIAVNAIATAGMGLLLFVADDQQLRSITIWMLGSLSGRPWSEVLPALPLILLGVVGLLVLARPLNALMLGEREAFHLGFDVERVKRRMVLLVALATGAAVAVSGIIGFVGLVVPHLVRLLLGADNRLVLPASALTGATLLLLADLAARHVVLPAELPIGILTSLIGGPFFIWLLLTRLRQRNA